jgi:hypothetical protein
VTRWTCQHRGIKLSDTHSCGARCAIFPSCLPPLPPEVVEEVCQLHLAIEAQHRRSVAVADFLELLRQALTDGLAKRDGGAPASENRRISR